MCQRFTERLINSRNLAIVLKPTNKNFDDFHLGDDLHIGIFDGKKEVRSFSRSGITTDLYHTWIDALVIYEFSVQVTSRSLEDFCHRKNSHYSIKMYDEHSFNCLNFVLDFMATIDPQNDLNKPQFVNEFVKLPLAQLIYNKQATNIQ